MGFFKCKYTAIQHSWVWAWQSSTPAFWNNSHLKFEFLDESYLKTLISSILDICNQQICQDFSKTKIIRDDNFLELWLSLSPTFTNFYHHLPSLANFGKFLQLLDEEWEIYWISRYSLKKIVSFLTYCILIHYWHSFIASMGQT